MGEDDLRQLVDQMARLETRLSDLETKVAGIQANVHEPTAPNPSSSTDLGQERAGDHDRPLSVSLVSREFHKANYLANEAGDRIDMVLRFTSSLTKDARAFRGTVVINDLFDQEVISFTVGYDLGIMAGGVLDWRGGIPFNQFMPAHQAFLRLEPSDSTTSCRSVSVIYTDGTREDFL